MAARERSRIFGFMKMTRKDQDGKLKMPDKALLVGAGGFEPPKHKQQIYSLSPLAARERSHIDGSLEVTRGAGDRSRTNNLLITNQLLCH